MNISESTGSVRSTEPKIFNGVDDPNVSSMSSVGVYEESIDETEKKEEAKPEDNAEVVKKDEPGEKKDDKPKEEPPAKTQAELDKEKHDDEEKRKKAEEDRRFASVTKARRMAERENEDLKNRNKALEEENKKLRSQVPVKDKPKREDFDDEDKYIEALADWKYEQKRHEENKVIEEVTMSEEQKQAAMELDTELDTTMTKGREKYPDFNSLVLGDDDLPLTTVMIQSALSTDIAEDILYYLAKHRDEAGTIAVMHPLKVAREITKIEEKLIKESAQEPVIPGKPEEPKPSESQTPPPPGNKVPGAPPPIEPPRQEGLTEKDPEKMNAREYRQWREAQKRT